MVCLGNICRSPLAHGILEKLIIENQLSWTVDSCGTNGLHDGESPDPRSIREAKLHDLDISKQISRRITNDDFIHFDLILVMDQMNYFTVNKLAPPYQKEKFNFLPNLHSQEKTNQYQIPIMIINFKKFIASLKLAAMP